MDFVPSEELTVIRRRQRNSGRTINGCEPTSREDLIKAFADLPAEDFEQFRADMDALVDPTPRAWSDP